MPEIPKRLLKNTPIVPSTVVGDYMAKRKKQQQSSSPTPPNVPTRPLKQSTTNDEPDRLRPYTFHGVELTQRGSHAIGTCPFCSKVGKFSVEIDSGLWRCWVCGSGTDNGGGNAHVFLRMLWDRSDAATNGSAKLFAQERGFLDPMTVTAWGVCQSIVDGTWLIPGYGIDGKLRQLYRRTKMLNKGKWVWTNLPTPGVWPLGKSHGLHMATSTFDPMRKTVDIAEGPWDGMAMWEVMSQVRRDGHGKLELTGNPALSLLTESNIIAVPGCSSFLDDWLPMFKDADVTFWFDSDHPRIEHGKTFRSGFDGVYRNARKLSGIARSVRWIKWGKEGYDESKKDGWDVRDHLKQAKDIAGRKNLLAELMGRVEHVPPDWFDPNGTTASNGSNGNGTDRPNINPMDCDNWRTVEDAWKTAQEWRPTMRQVLATMVAVVVSTPQAGNQLFLQVVGSPGTGKTTFCNALLVSQSCHMLNKISNFHSGWKMPGDKDKDCSLIARVNMKCLVSPEGDIIMSNPKYDELMSQVRQIFDGATSSSYGNSDKDTVHQGLRTPWIMGITPAMMEKDQSRVGDRFIRIFIDSPSDAVKNSILWNALENEMSAMMERSNGTAGSVLDPALRRAYGLTGGYIDYLHANLSDLLPMVVMPRSAQEMCISLAELTAYMRARPNMDVKKLEIHDTVELPTRLTRQYGRLMKCLAVVLNKQTVDDEVVKIVRKIALDTSHGHTLTLCQRLAKVNTKCENRFDQQHYGLTGDNIGQYFALPDDKTTQYLHFLRKINVAVCRQAHGKVNFWALTERVYNLYKTVIKD